MTKPILFVSDLHLGEHDPATVDAFIAFLRNQARHAHALYLLGDIFEYWIGDDNDDALALRIASELRALAEYGCALYMLHGNRDFLVGELYAQRARLQLLPDPYPVHAFAQALLLSHGDALCTDDLAYQQFRKTVRQLPWQQAFLARSLQERRAQAAQLRAQSKMANQQKSMSIMDVNQAAVAALLCQNPSAILIHGHTHRPAVHHVHLEHASHQRWVLPDWHNGKGGYLQLDQTGLKFHGVNQNAAWGDID